MGTIGSSLSGYYQLSSLLSSGSGSSGSSATSELNSLEQMLQSADSGSSSSGASSYLLDLSPEAKQLMNSGSTSSSGSGSSSFTLTSAQQAAVEKIIEKYKNAPFDQANFNEMQNDLQAAGLSPQTLGAEDQVKSFDPTGVLLDSLSGNYASIQTPGATQSDEQTKESNYLKSIMSMWKSESTASSASGSASSTVASVTASA